MKKHGKHILVVLLFVALTLPMLQRQLTLFHEKPLFGHFPSAPSPHFSTANWLSGHYQDSLAIHAMSTAGFRSALARLNNQYFYSLFNIAKANGVVPGKEHFLYDRAHIDAYLGKDFIGYPATQKRFSMLHDLSQLLRKKGIRLQLVFAPGKASAVPENLPNGTPEPGKVTNYSLHRHLADSLKIPLLDLYAWYQGIKPKSAYPLYPSGGIHWSAYCATLAADTLAGHLAAATKQSLNRFKIKDIERSEDERGEDGDIARGLNLLWPIPSKPAGYPVLEWQSRPTNLHVLSVGDSYYFKYFTEFAPQVFASSRFMFYFHDTYFQGEPVPTPTRTLDLHKHIESSDVILLYAADANLPRFGWGFIESAWHLYFNPLSRDPQLRRISAKIRQDSNWMAQIAQKASAKGISQAEALAQDALWVWENVRNP